MLIYGFSNSAAHHMFPRVAGELSSTKADRLDLLQSTRRPFKSMDLALSREGQPTGSKKSHYGFAWLGMVNNAMAVGVLECYNIE